MRIRDLFCGAGACSVGYQRAGLTVVGGVDIIDHPDYPFSLLVKDVMEMSPEQIADGADVIHASPPCQADTTMSNRWRGHGGKADSHPRLIAETRELLDETGLPYVIENVPGAKRHMRNPVTLTGGMFGLGVHRPRLFETNFPVQAPPPFEAADRRARRLRQGTRRAPTVHAQGRKHPAGAAHARGSAAGHGHRLDGLG